MPDDLAGLDATAQAALVRRGDVIAIELVDAAIARIERLNPRLNAVIYEHFDRAPGGARQFARRPLVAWTHTAELLRFTIPFNVTGQPAISLPLHWSREGLPIGVQLVAAFGREDLLLRVAAQLEADGAWRVRRPPVHA